MSQVASAPPIVLESPQPTVRVMRLYQPVMYISPPVPQVRVPENINNAANFNSESDFALSNCLLLPDSFGDIYLGEKFSAYVSVVNSTQDITFTSIQLSVKLQSTQATHDMEDVRPSAGKPSGRTGALKPNEFVDLVVSHPIANLGTHSLKVFVDYVDPQTGEQKTLKKFYKFSSLNPLLISSSVLDLGCIFAVQCQLTKCTRGILHVDEVSMQCQRDLTVTKTVPNISDDDVAKFAFMASLGPDEKYAESFILEKPVGFHSASIGVVVVKWSTTMGEHGYIRGDELMAPDLTPLAGVAPPISSEPPPQIALPPPPIRNSSSIIRQRSSLTSAGNSNLIVYYSGCPSEVRSHEEFTVELRIFNNSYTSSAKINIRLPDTSSGQSILVVGKTSWNEGLLQARSYVDIILHVVAMSSGLHEFGGLYIRDSISNSEALYGASILNIYAFDGSGINKLSS